jgi:hypothetical protein
MALAFFFGSFGFGNDLCLEVGGYTAVSQKLHANTPRPWVMERKSAV